MFFDKYDGQQLSIKEIQGSLSCTNSSEDLVQSAKIGVFRKTELEEPILILFAQSEHFVRLRLDFFHAETLSVPARLANMSLRLAHSSSQP